MSNPLRITLGEVTNYPLKVVTNDEKGVVLQFEDTTISMTRCSSGGYYTKKQGLNDLVVLVNNKERHVSSVDIIEDILGYEILKISFR